MPSYKRWRNVKFAKLLSMLRITYKTPDDVLENIKIGDHISDEYQLNGIVKEIERENVWNGFVYTFHLDSGRKIVVLR
jgi:hypothetical protein